MIFKISFMIFCKIHVAHYAWISRCIIVRNRDVLWRQKVEPRAARRWRHLKNGAKHKRGDQIRSNQIDFKEKNCNIKLWTLWCTNSAYVSASKINNMQDRSCGIIELSGDVMTMPPTPSRNQRTPPPKLCPCRKHVFKINLRRAIP